MATHNGSLFQHVLASFKTQLEPNLLSQFDMTSIQDLKREVLAIQREHVSKKRLQNMHRLEGFIAAMEQYGKVIEVFLNASDILAFVWGPMKFLLQIVSSFSDAFNSLLDTYQIIGESLPMLDKCQGFLENSPYVQQALQSIFRDILEFHQQALKYFRKPLLKQIFQETWPNYRTKFGPIIDNLKRHKQLVEGRITFTQLETVIANSAKALGELERQRRSDENIQHRAVRCWLNSADVQVDQESVSEVRSTNRNAGQWLLQNDLFRAWQHVENADPLLWLNGIPGAGKTVLASLIIDQCRKLNSKTTIWFYCKNGDNQRKTFIALARALISQLLNHDMDLLPYIYAKMCCRGEPLLLSEELAKEILETSLKSSAGLYIIIDGLDECDREEEKKIIEFLRSMVNSSQVVHRNSMRCVFVSQSDAVTAKVLQDLPTIDMKPHHNHDDIVAFVSSRGADIRNKFQLSEEIVQHMNSLVVQKAEGMFLFAKLVMTSLSSQISQERLLEELQDKGIPDGLGNAYLRVLTVALDRNSRTEALQLLAWLVCSKRQLKWREVQGAVSIDLQSFSVDFQSRQWVLDSKDLCGSLIHLRSDGSLELVHTTAKYYLIESGTVNVQQEELKMASLCVGYLSLPGFHSLLGDKSVKELLNYGYYAFLDYAACHWTSHLKAGLASGIDETNARSLVNLLQEFLSAHYRDSGKRFEIPEDTRQIFNRLQVQNTRPDFERLLEAFHATEKQVLGFGESAALNYTLDIPDIIARIRRFLEEAQADTVSRFYGAQLFKCPRMSCDFFHRGFCTSKQRDDHMMKHNRPFGCSFPGCLRAALAFSSQRELEKHISQAHETKKSDNNFPSKRKRPALQCGGCEEYFYEPKKLLGHACTMTRNHLKRNDGSPDFMTRDSGLVDLKRGHRNLPMADMLAMPGMSPLTSTAQGYGMGIPSTQQSLNRPPHSDSRQRKDHSSASPSIASPSMFAMNQQRQELQSQPQSLQQTQQQLHTYQQQREYYHQQDQQQDQQELLQVQRLEQVRLEQERVEQERVEQERVEQERVEQKRVEQLRLEYLRLEQKHLEQKHLEQKRQKELLELQRVEQKRLEQLRLEQLCLEQKHLEQKRQKQERLQQERLQQERLVQERLEQEFLNL